MATEGFCRGCLIKYNEPSDLLQYTEKNRRLFVYSTGLQVKRNDVFTFQLCKDCYINMKLACKFKKLCRTSDKRFKNYYALKEIDETIDLCNFLKQNDDNFNFRFPLASGNSTPANQKYKEDDNESICTSIRNFMTDILQGEEMPDTEAKIIKEVIEEEADVLDDSLDSHWLQDDVSIDTDFRLDFSFSPFSTPRSVRHDHCNTPMKLSKEKEQQQMNYYTSKAIIEKPDQIDHLNIINEAIKNIPNNDNESTFKGLVASQKSFDVIDGINGTFGIVTEPEEIIQDNELHHENEGIGNEYEEINKEIEQIENKRYGINAQNYYIQRDFDANLDIAIDNKNVENSDQCTIDKNLEIALKDESTEKFSLDDLLVSPPVFPDVTGPMTPTITNILFSEKLDINSPNKENNMGQCIEPFHNVEGDIDSFEGLFYNSKDYDPNVVITSTVDGQRETEELKTNIEINDLINKDGVRITFENINKDDFTDPWILGNNFDIENLYCKLCEKQCKSLKSLRLHACKTHKIRIISKGRKFSNYKRKICDICGKAFRDPANFIRHRKVHEDENKIFKCDICCLICTNKAKLNQHRKTHDGVVTDNIPRKRYMCTICGSSLSSQSNFRIHQRRHDKSYRLHCSECGKGFYRNSDLTNHMRLHTQEKPFQCPHCNNYFSQSSALAQHIKKFHLAERYFECDCCGIKFKKKTELRKHLKSKTRRKILTKKSVKKSKLFNVATKDSKIM